MRKDDSLEKLRRKLLIQGLPSKYVARTIREMAEHREDLEEQARSQGVFAEAARQFAEERLGDTEALAKALVKTNRLRDWWGRHPLLSVGLLPLPCLFSVLFGFLVLIALGTGWADWPDDQQNLAEPDWAVITFWFYSVGYLANATIAVFFCFLARRCYCSFKWALAACGVASMHGLFFGSGLTLPHAAERGGFWMGYTLTAPDLVGFATPLIVVGIFFLRCLRAAQSTETSTPKHIA